ncbi:MAG: DivIVA domain-containing protein, partial [Ilumatobacteraceae bacterium]
MAISFSRPDPSSAGAVSEASFSTGRRGFDQQEVRDFLRMVGAELARLQERERFLERELRTAQQRSPSEAMVDDDTVTQLLGEEATRILTAARESASAIRTKAEEGAARLLRESSEEAQRQREEADLDAARRRSDAAADAESHLITAKQQGREMVEEARGYRERVLGELSRRRELARQQLEHLIHGRERLLQAFERARLVAVDVVAEMTPVDEPGEYVDLSPTTGPVPIMVPAGRVGDASAIDESILRMPANKPVAAPSEDAAGDDAVDGAPPSLEVVPDLEEDPPPALYDGGDDDVGGSDVDLVDAVSGEDVEVADIEVVDIEVVEDEGAQDKIDDDDDAAAADVANLFARLRANRPEDAVTDDTETDDETDADDDAEPIEETPFRQRDAALVPLITSAARKLKRLLADEQNEV